MKNKDFINEQHPVDEDTCDICELSERAQDFITKHQKEHPDFITIGNTFFCPVCSKPLTIDPLDDVVPITSYDPEDEDDEVYFSQLLHCENCDKEFFLAPTRCQWNANHDVHLHFGKKRIDYDVINEIVDQSMSNIKDEMDKRGMTDHCESLMCALQSRLRVELHNVVPEVLAKHNVAVYHAEGTPPEIIPECVK